MIKQELRRGVGKYSGVAYAAVAAIGVGRALTGGSLVRTTAEIVVGTIVGAGILGRETIPAKTRDKFGKRTEGAYLKAESALLVLGPALLAFSDGISNLTPADIAEIALAGSSIAGIVVSAEILSK